MLSSTYNKELNKGYHTIPLAIQCHVQCTEGHDMHSACSLCAHTIRAIHVRTEKSHCSLRPLTLTPFTKMVATLSIPNKDKTLQRTYGITLLCVVGSKCFLSFMLLLTMTVLTGCCQLTSVISKSLLILLIWRYCCEYLQSYLVLNHFNNTHH